MYLLGYTLFPFRSSFLSDPRANSLKTWSIFICVLILGGFAIQPVPGQALAPGGDPFRGVQDALLRNDVPGARSLLSAISFPAPGTPEAETYLARRALLEAAAAPVPERSRALLGVARAFSHRREGLTALIACLHQLEQILGDRIPFDFKVEDLKCQYRSCVSLLSSWRARAAGDFRIPLAEALLRTCDLDIFTVGSASLRPSLILPGNESIPVPSPLTEAVRLRLFHLSRPEETILIHERREFPLREALTPFLAEDPPRPPVLERTLSPGGGSRPLPVQPPGMYLLEVRSVTNGWRHMRVVVVTDLDLIMQTSCNGFVLLATLGGRPAPGVDIRIAGQNRSLGKTDERGLLAAPFPDSARNSWITLLGRCGVHWNTACLYTPSDPSSAMPELTSHLFLERSVYRPGETVLGRIVVRKHESGTALQEVFGTACDTSTRSRPLENRLVVVHFTLSKKVKHEVRLRTDALGTAVFRIPLKASAPVGPVTVRARIPVRRKNEFLGAGDPLHRYGPHVALGPWYSAFEVQAYRRPPVLWEVAWPEAPLPREAAPVVTITSRSPGGSPAPGLAGRFTVKVDRMEHTVPFFLDRRGKARVILAWKELVLPPGRVSLACTVSLTAADGQVLTRKKTLVLPPIRTAAAGPSSVPAARDTRLRLSLPSSPWPAGKDVPVTLTGPPRTPVLLTLNRAGILAARVVLLDDQGQAVASLPTRKSWSPSVRVCAALPGRARSDRWTLVAWRRLRLEDPRHRLRIGLEGMAREYGPGDRAQWRVLIRDGEGNPVSATVAVAVVDERLARVMKASGKDPGRALAPGWCQGQTCFYRSDLPAAHGRFYQNLIEDGEVQFFFGRPYNGPSGACPAPGSPVGPRPRVDFRMAAHFVGDLRTGPDGCGEIAFTFPDDLTTWRVRVVAVDPGRGAGWHEARVCTVRDPALTPLLPRFLRESDRIQVPLLARSTKGLLPPGGCIIATAGGGLLLDSPRKAPPFPKEPGRSRTRTVSLLGRSSGTGTLRASLLTAKGESLDRIEVPVSVVPRTVTRRLWTAAWVEKEETCRPPCLEGKTPARLTWRVQGGIALLLRDAGHFLDRYPHGCAEQVTSCLTPMILALRAGRSLSPVRARRLEAGLARLRHYRNSDGGFTWWGAGPTDPQISACVFRFLALAREAGHGLRVDADCPLFTRARNHILDAGSKIPDHNLAEICVCNLLLFPEHEAARKACLLLAGRAADFPSGLLSRCGQALARAGDPEVPLNILAHLRHRLSTGEAHVRPDPDALMESPAARLSALLELVMAVSPGDPLQSRLMKRLLGLCKGGCFDHTFGTAASLVALRKCLALLPPDTGEESIKVLLKAPGWRREVVLSKEARWEAVCPGRPECGSVTVVNPSGRPLLVQGVADFSEDGARAGPLAHPLRLKRELMRLRPGETGALTRREAVKRIRAGDPLEVVLTLEGVESRRYLVVECPLPAGFEVIRTGKNEEIHEDRVVRCFLAGEKITWRIRIQAERAGCMIWPPARVADMYDPEVWGRSAGACLEVDPAPARPENGLPGRVLTRRSFEARLPALRERLCGSRTRDDCIAALKALAAVPVPQEDWFFSSAPAILCAHLDHPYVVEAYVRALGSRVKERVQGQSLSELLHLAGVNPERLLENLGRSLVRYDYTAWALEKLSHPSGLDSSEIRLFTVVCLLDDETLHGKDPSGFFQRLTTTYSRIPEAIRARAVVNRIEDLAGRSEENPLPIPEVVQWGFRAWESVDFEDKATLADSLQDILAEEAPGGVNSHTFPSLVALRRKSRAAAFEAMTPDTLSREDFQDTFTRLLVVGSQGLPEEEIEPYLTRAASRILTLRDVPGKEKCFLVAAAGFLESISETFEAFDSEHVLDALALPVFYSRLRSANEAVFWDEDLGWDQISKQGQRTVPPSLLLSRVEGYGETWAAKALLGQGGRAREALFAALPRIRSDEVKEVVLEQLPDPVLQRMPLIGLLSLAQEWSWMEEEVQTRLQRALSHGSHDNRDLARALSRSRDPGARLLLVNVLAERGCSTVHFEAGDPAAPFYRNLLHARLGEKEAVKEARRMLFSSATLPGEGDALELLQAISSSLSLEDLILFESRFRKAYIPDSVLRMVLSRSDLGRILTIMQKQHPEDSWRDRLFSMACNSLSAARAPRLMTSKLSPEVASDLVDCLWVTPRLDVALASRLLGHPDRNVRLEVEALIRRRLGDPGTWFPGEAALKGLMEFHAGVIKEGLSALEKALGSRSPDQRQAALILLARSGLYLE